VVASEGSVWGEWSVLSKFLALAAVYDCCFTLVFLAHLLKLRFRSDVSRQPVGAAIVRLNKTALAMVMFNIIQTCSTLGYSTQNLQAFASALGSVCAALYALKGRSSKFGALVSDLEAARKTVAGGDLEQQDIDKEAGFATTQPNPLHAGTAVTARDGHGSTGEKDGAGNEANCSSTSIPIQQWLSAQGIPREQASDYAKKLAADGQRYLREEIGMKEAHSLKVLRGLAAQQNNDGRSGYPAEPSTAQI
jgi:hypothetical protein